MQDERLEQHRVPDLVSVIVTTYERTDALEAVLSALSRQSDGGFEVVIADDGSGPATAALVDGWRARLGVPLTHVWQAHRGFRAAEIRNRAILAAHGDYCVFLDGDCIPPADFVAIHRKLAERGWFVTGNRALLSRELSAAVLREDLRPEAWSLLTWLEQRLRGGVNRLAAVIRLPLGPLRKLGAQRWRGARSCNLGVWRRDLDRVDGFDADFNGWGREDSDLLIRLLHCGSRRKDGRFATGVIHLWHPPADRAHLAANDARLDAVLHSDRTRAPRGLSTLRADAGRADTHRHDEHARAPS
ncbi:MAG TPA: glycosyltransferase family 2 protein [Xanthobacteraceae bacterium]|jgi:glycosyltransferase involved in cell wall biosynthesis